MSAHYGGMQRTHLHATHDAVALAHKPRSALGLVGLACLLIHVSDERLDLNLLDGVVDVQHAVESSGDD